MRVMLRNAGNCIVTCEVKWKPTFLLTPSSLSLPVDPGLTKLTGL